MNARDVNILEHIIGYCEEITQTIKNFDDKLETLKVWKNYTKRLFLTSLH